MNSEYMPKHAPNKDLLAVGWGGPTGYFLTENKISSQQELKRNVDGLEDDVDFDSVSCFSLQKSVKPISIHARSAHLQF